ncbi:type II toxin-antitoxin system ParD family antitoxin, partial [Klebsiella aerogenes]|uniref:type II toxin-antitoxin system ParD family antitoxin n=1 Tax=Klebsiella aerogenes TaxID=548 RepID=UPI0013D7B442
TMTTRNVNLTPALDEFVETQLQSGAYQNASEVVRAGLRLLKADEEARAVRLAALKAAVEVGLAQLQRGESIAVDDVDAWLAGLGQVDV